MEGEYVMAWVLFKLIASWIIEKEHLDSTLKARGRG